jgi:predicted DNA-binding antitoxin AbrB/MazE fold protein
MKEQIITAVYEDGVLRPLGPLQLPERAKVKLIIGETEDQIEPADPFFEIIGAYSSEKPLIDGIPVSEDADLYLLAEMMGDEAIGLHAWEIAPARYRRGANNQPIRKADSG